MADGYRDLPSNDGSKSDAGIRLLHVEPDDGLALALKQHLADRFAGVVVTRCQALTAARAYLSGNAFEVVLVAEELADGSGLDLLELRDTLQRDSHFFVRANGIEARANAPLETHQTSYLFLTPELDSLNAFSSTLSKVLGMPERFHTIPGMPENQKLSADAATAMLRELRAEAGAVAHAINNPLTVITGNAQFILEVARMEKTDVTILGPIEDINAAVQQLTDALRGLAALRERIAVALGTDDTINES